MTSTNIYNEAFERARPNLAFTAVSDRVALLRALTTDLTSYFHERALLEDAYVKSLSRLSTRLHTPGKEGVMTAVESLGLQKKDEERQLGAWKAVRDRLEAELRETSRVHETWRKKLDADVEAAIRNSLSKSDWVRYQQSENILGATAKDYESTLDKVAKAQSKSGSKASKSATTKLLTAQSSLSSLGTTLTSGMPAFLASAEALETSHSTFLKEALVRFGTLNSDLGRERMEGGERILVAVLAVDEQAEMQGWALRESMRTGATTQTNGNLNPRARSGTQDSAAPSSLNEFGQVAETRAPPIIRHDSIAEEPVEPVLPPPVVTPAKEDRVRATSTTSRPAMPPPASSLGLPTATTPSKSSGSGFKFSSILKRDRSSSQAGSSKYGQLDGPSSSSQALDASTSLAGGTSLNRATSYESRDSEGPEDAFGRAGSAGLAMQAPIQPDRRPAASSGTPKKRDSLMPFSSGGLFRRPSKAGSSPSGSPAIEHRESEGGLARPFNENEARGTRVDNEGFSIPPAGYDRQIGEQPGPGAGSKNLMDEDDEEEITSSAIPPPKLPPVTLAPTTIVESADERQAALDRMKSTLLSGGPSTNVSRRATRGRRDVRTTTYNPTIPDDVPLAKLVEQSRAQNRAAQPESPSRSSTFSPPFSGSPTITTFPGERANSILSTVSSSFAVTRNGGVDPFEHATTPGLRASIVETVNVLLKGGEVTRVMIAGEIALSNRLTEDSTPSPVLLRIHNYEQFEKAAPNSAFLTPIADAPGEYTLSPSLQAPTCTVLKYQVHIAEGFEKEFVPLNVRAAWQCQPSQTRVIVSYSTNSSSKLAAAGTEESPFGEDELKLEDVSFQVPISAPVSTFQAKPTAQWESDKGRLTFSLDGIVFGAAEEKLLASVVTESAASPQPIAVRWKVAGRSVSGVQVEVVGGEAIETVRSTVSGRYLVAP